ncbi:GDSL esterase/lipase At1g29670 [Linum perenne]
MANYTPYGIDFPSGPTGRYTNGKNVVDLLCDKLGIPLLPASRNPSTAADGGKGIFHGVDFASGGSGILNNTGILINYFLNLTNPRPNLEDFTSNLISSLSAKIQVNNNSVFFFSVRVTLISKRFNWLRKSIISGTKIHYFGYENRSMMTGVFLLYLQHLHGLGARKFVLMSLNPLGCSPFVLIRNPKTGKFTCAQPLNQAAQLFNKKQKSMVDRLNQQLPDSKLVIVNAYGIISKILSNPRVAGFRDSSNSCCETITVPCIRGGKACKDRKDHVFFDAHHPTEAVNVQIVNKAYSSRIADEVYPINVKQLAEL